MIFFRFGLIFTYFCCFHATRIRIAEMKGIHTDPDPQFLPRLKGTYPHGSESSLLPHHVGDVGEYPLGQLLLTPQRLHPGLNRGHTDMAVLLTNVFVLMPF